MRTTEKERRSEENPRAEPDVLSVLTTPAWLRSCRNPVVMTEAKALVAGAELAATLRKHVAGDWSDQPAMKESNEAALRHGGVVATCHRCGNLVDLYAVTTYAPGVIPAQTRTIIGTESDLERILRVGHVVGDVAATTPGRVP